MESATPRTRLLVLPARRPSPGAAAAWAVAAVLPATVAAVAGWPGPAGGLPLAAVALVSGALATVAAVVGDLRVIGELRRPLPLEHPVVALVALTILLTPPGVLGWIGGGALVVLVAAELWAAGRWGAIMLPFLLVGVVLVGLLDLPLLSWGLTGGLLIAAGLRWRLAAGSVAMRTAAPFAALAVAAAGSAAERPDVAVVALATAGLVGAGAELARLLSVAETQRATAARLQRLGQRSGALVDSLPALVLTLDPEARLRSSNREAAAVLGLPEGPSPPGVESWSEAFLPSDRARLQEAVAEVLSGSGIRRFPARCQDSGGGRRWLEVEILPFRDPVEEDAGVALVGVDITDLVRARQAAEQRGSRLAFLSELARTVAGETAEEVVLAASLEMFRHLFPMVTVCLYRVGDDGGLHLAALASDRGAVARVGGRVEDGHPAAVAAELGDLVLEAIDAETVDPLVEAAGDGVDLRQLMFLPLRAAGGVVGVLGGGLAAPLMDEPEERDLLTQVGVLLGGALHLVRVVRELEDQRRLALEASRLKSEFLANTSHELRTPLTSILGFLRLYLDGVIDDEAQQREFLGLAHDAAKKLLTIINDVLDLSKIEAGRIEVQVGHHRVAPLLEEVESLFRHQLEMKGVEFEVELEAPDLEAWIDPDRTVQVLTNLLSNAAKFTPAGGRIRCRGVDGGDAVELLVEDSGIGIPSDQLGRVMESFYQVDGSTTRGYGGTGLGLTISLLLAERMGGQLELESGGPNTGTTARLTLPKKSPPTTAGS